MNSNLTITGERVVLVPYRKEHVPVYHGWMVRRVAFRVNYRVPAGFQVAWPMQTGLAWRRRILHFKRQQRHSLSQLRCA